jgi:succinate dehydrogenase flavin-adding protein (antitoxin of CptAB toxin-antitoxin module)
MADPDLYTLITGKTRSDDAQVMRVVEALRRTLAV